MAVISRIIIDPFGLQPDRVTTSSKSIFKEQNLRSGNINSNSLTQLTSMFANNSILEDLKITSITFSNSNRTLNITLSPGKLVQDRVLFKITESINLSVDVFSSYTIQDVSITENYFTITGDYVENFPPTKTFGVFNSTNAGYNHINWSVITSSYNSGTNRTTIYTSQSLTVDNSTGIIVNDNFPNSDDSVKGAIIITSEYKYMDSVENNPIKFIPVYMNSTYEYTPTFSVNLNKIIYAVLSITKDMVNFTISPTVYKVEDEAVDLIIHGTTYPIHNITNSVTGLLEGGSLTV